MKNYGQVLKIEKNIVFIILLLYRGNERLGNTAMGM